MKKSILTSALLCLILLLSACSTTNPITGKKQFNTVSESEESRLGKKYHQLLIKQQGIMDDLIIEKKVNKIGKRLVKELPDKRFNYTFSITDAPMINAFAIPGGYIYLTRGIISYFNTTDELAAVIGHEITHVAAKHTAQRISQRNVSTLFNIGVLLATQSRAALELSNTLSGALLAGYGRENELESDQYGLNLAYQANYDPEGALSFMQTLHRNSKTRADVFSTLFASHPPTKDRIKKLEDLLNQLDYTPTSYQTHLKNRASYLREIEGILLGPAPKKGYFTKKDYHNPSYNISIPLNKKWKLKINPKSPYLSFNNDNKTIKGTLYFLTPREKKSSSFLKTLSKHTYQSKHVAGNITQIYTKKISQKTTQFRFYFSKHQRYYVAEFTGPKNTVYQEALSIIKNIKFRAPKEAKAFGVGLLELYRPKAGDTYRSLSQRFYNTYEYATHLAAFNGQNNDDKPYPLIKIYLPVKKKIKST